MDKMNKKHIDCCVRVISGMAGGLARWDGNDSHWPQPQTTYKGYKKITGADYKKSKKKIIYNNI